MWLGLIPNHIIHVYLKESCPIPPSCTGWKNHKIDEAEKWEFTFVDRQALFKDIMSTELKPPKKPTNHLNSIYCDTPTPEKPKRII
jgi:NADH:ubiquinone oxidoreductase subunit